MWACLQRALRASVKKSVTGGPERMVSISTKERLYLSTRYHLRVRNLRRSLLVELNKGKWKWEAEKAERENCSQAIRTFNT